MTRRSRKARPQSRRLFGMFGMMGAEHRVALWGSAVEPRSSDSESILDEFIDLDSIATPEDFARALSVLQQRSGMTIAAVAQAAGKSQTVVNDYMRARLLPDERALRDLLNVLKIRSASVLEQWRTARERVNQRVTSMVLSRPYVLAARSILEDRSQAQTDSSHSEETDEADLLFRVYIPSERLYAAEASRLLSLFHDWLITTRGQGVRQSSYRTTSGDMYEFFADASVVQPDLREEFDSFSDFLTLCAENPTVAADLLTSTGLDRASCADLVARFGREVQRLQIDLRHEREQRVLTIRHSLEDQLLENGIDLQAIPTGQLNTMIGSLVPGPSAPESLALLAAPWTARPTAPVTVINNPQIISAMESTIIQNVQGTIHLGLEAKKLLDFIGKFCGQGAATLQSAVYELEDPAAPPAARSAARQRLKNFISQIAGAARDVGVALFTDYLKSKGM
jgi:hypothetical protein